MYVVYVIIINEVEVNIKPRCTDLDVSSNTGKYKLINHEPLIIQVITGKYLQGNVMYNVKIETNSINK